MAWSSVVVDACGIVADVVWGTVAEVVWGAVVVIIERIAVLVVVLGSTAVSFVMAVDPDEEVSDDSHRRPQADSRGSTIPAAIKKAQIFMFFIGFSNTSQLFLLYKTQKMSIRDVKFTKMEL